MKKVFFLFAVVFIFLGTASGNDTTSCHIIFFRLPDFYGSAMGYRIYANDRAVTKLKNNSCFDFECGPGTYDLWVGNFREHVLHLDMEAGQTCYVRFNLLTGAWSAQPELIAVEADYARQIVDRGKMRAMDALDGPHPELKNRIGLSLGIGGGFNDIPMFTMQNNDEAGISFGGGYFAGIRYGHEIGNYLDLAFDLDYQGSLLSPPLSNAGVVYKRVLFSVTPSVIIPIQGGEAMRFKAGGGFDGYWKNKLVIESSEIKDGFDETWRYHDSFGYHFTFLFEWNTTEQWSMLYGLRYYSVDYKFASGEGHVPLDDDLGKPDGSGIDLFFGMFYHF